MGTPDVVGNHPPASAPPPPESGGEPRRSIPRPGGPADNSPRREPWERATPPQAPAGAADCGPRRASRGIKCRRTVQAPAGAAECGPRRASRGIKCRRTVQAPAGAADCGHGEPAVGLSAGARFKPRQGRQIVAHGEPAVGLSAGARFKPRQGRRTFAPGVTLQDSFAPAGARVLAGLPPRLTPWAIIFRRSAAGSNNGFSSPHGLRRGLIIFRRSAAGSNSGFSSPHGSRRGLLSSAAPRLRATTASPPPTAHAVGYYLPPLRGCEQQRLLLSPRLTPWAIIFRRSAAGSNSGFSSPHGLRRGLLSSAAPRLRATAASPPPTAHAVGYYLPPLRGCEQQRLLLPPRLTPWAIIFRRSAA